MSRSTLSATPPALTTASRDDTEEDITLSSVNGAIRLFLPAGAQIGSLQPLNGSAGKEYVSKGEPIAVFRDVFLNYDITQNPDGTWTVAHTLLPVASVMRSTT